MLFYCSLGKYHSSHSHLIPRSDPNPKDECMQLTSTVCVYVWNLRGLQQHVLRYTSSLALGGVGHDRDLCPTWSVGGVIRWEGLLPEAGWEIMGFVPRLSNSDFAAVKFCLGFFPHELMKLGLLVFLCGLWFWFLAFWIFVIVKFAVWMKIWRLGRVLLFCWFADTLPWLAVFTVLCFYWYKVVNALFFLLLLVFSSVVNFVFIESSLLHPAVLLPLL